MNGPEAIALWRSRTASLYNPESHLGLSADAIELEAVESVESVLLESDLASIVTVRDVILAGSASRGLETADSDLDFIVWYEGDVREDTLFDILAEAEIVIVGRKADLNPISERYSGPIVNYLAAADRYLADKAESLLGSPIPVSVSEMGQHEPRFDYPSFRNR